MTSVCRHRVRSPVPCFPTVLRGLLLALLAAWLPATPASAVPPAQPLLRSPGPDALVNGTETLFEWTTDPSADNYCIALARDSVFSDLLVDVCLGARGDVTVEGLPDNGLPIFWRIEAVRGTESSLSAPGQFVNGPSAAPGAPSALLPLDGSNAAGEVIRFSWQPAPRAANYVFEISLVPDFADAGTQRANTGLSRSVTFRGLQGLGIRYYWRITANNAAGTGPSVAQSFVNTPAVALSGTSRGQPIGQVQRVDGRMVIVADPAPRTTHEIVLEATPAP